VFLKDPLIKLNARGTSSSGLIRGKLLVDRGGIHHVLIGGVVLTSCVEKKKMPGERGQDWGEQQDSKPRIRLLESPGGKNGVETHDMGGHPRSKYEGGVWLRQILQGQLCTTLKEIHMTMLGGRRGQAGV